MNCLILAASVVLSWIPVEGAQYYNLYMGTKSMKDGSNAPTRTYKSTAPTYNVPNLNSGTTYYFYVRTYCPFGTVLGNSNEIIYTPK